MLQVSTGEENLCKLKWFHGVSNSIGAIRVLRNANGGGGCQIFWKKALRRCKVQCYYRYEEVGFQGKNRYVTLEWPHPSIIIIILPPLCFQ